MGVMAANAFYIDLGYSLEVIAAVVKFAGFWMTILGVMGGGVALIKFGTNRCLLIGILLTIVANLAYAWLATQHGSIASLVIALGAENFSSGFAGTALIASPRPNTPCSRRSMPCSGSCSAEHRG